MCALAFLLHLMVHPQLPFIGVWRIYGFLCVAPDTFLYEPCRFSGLVWVWKLIKILWVWPSSSFINTICSVCVARALIMPCKVCKAWKEGHWSRFPVLYGIGQVLRITRSGEWRPTRLCAARFPVWGRVEFWEYFVEWVLLCSAECHNRYIQDPEAIIFESQVNMFLWSSHLNITTWFPSWFVLSIVMKHDPQGNDAAPRPLWRKWHVPHVSSLRAMGGWPWTWTFYAKAQWKRQCLDSWKGTVRTSRASSFPLSSLGVCRLLGILRFEDAVMLWWVLQPSFPGSSRSYLRT